MNTDPRLYDTLAKLLGAAPRFDLACVGTSIHGLGAFTFEALACIACADIVFYYPPSKNHYDFMKRINNNLINVNETIYTKGAAFEPAYQEIMAEVMRTLKSGKKVAYAVQGSPAFHCGTAVRLHRIARQEGFSTLMISGVSSFELLSAELARRYDVTNIQIYSVDRITKGALAIDTRAPCLLFDLGRYALPAVRESASNFSRPKLDAFSKKLQSIYPKDHAIQIMYIANDGACRTSTTNPAGIVNALIRFGASATIFLPGLRR